MHRVGEHTFAPSGAPSVRIRFAMNGKQAGSLTIHDPEPLVVAKRIV